MCIETYGTGGRIKCAARLASSLKIPHLVILPVPTTKDGKTVFNTDIPLGDTLCNIDAGTLVAGYAMPQWYKEQIKERGAFCLDLSLDENFLIDNAYITALGALGYVFTTSAAIARDMKVGIVGYGRIGSALVKLFLFFGAKTKVFTSKAANCRALGECGIDCVCDEAVNFSDFSGLDILINTAPKDMKNSFADGAVPSGMRVLELASGDNFSGVRGVERLPSLPDKMYPESAGKSYYEAILRYISSQKD